MKPCGLFFAQRKSPPKWALQLSSFFIRCGAGCLPVSRRQSTDDSQCAKKTYQTGNAPPHRGIHHTKNLTSDETRFNALRRCDRGTDAMHLANTPVVSPESKKPKALTSGFSNFCCSVRFNVPNLPQFKHFPAHFASKICRHLCRMRHIMVRKVSILPNLSMCQFFCGK